jgi:hypothetical protein
LEKLVVKGCVWADLSDVYDDSIDEEIIPIAYVKMFPTNESFLSDSDVTRAVLCGHDVQKHNSYPRTLCGFAVCFFEVTSEINEIGFECFFGDTGFSGDADKIELAVNILSDLAGDKSQVYMYTMPVSDDEDYSLRSGFCIQRENLIFGIHMGKHILHDEP